MARLQKTVKPQYRNGGGNGNPQPPAPPTVTIAIGPPTNNQAVVGSNAGVNISVTCTVTVAGLSPLQTGRSMNVWVQLGNATAQVANTSTTRPYSQNGTTNWVYSGPTPTGGSLQINARVSLGYTNSDGPDSVDATAKPVTVVPSTLQLTVNVPTDGQVFVGTGAGYLLSTSGSASTTAPATIANVAWVIQNAAGNQVNNGTMTGPFGTSSCTWSGQIQLPLGICVLLITATDSNKNQQTFSSRLQVALTAGVLDISDQSYLQALVDFATKPFTGTGQARAQTNSGDLTLATIDSTFYRSIAVILGGNYARKANESVYEARICIESLRRYLANNVPTPAQAQAFAAAQAGYLQDAYSSLLSQIGTSFDEIRLARTYNRQDPQGLANAQALAARLGIDLGSTTDPYGGYIGDHLDRLCLAPKGTPDTTLVFQLTATDSSGAVDNATVSVVVYGNNSAIAVTAGKNQTVNKGTVVALTASAADSTPGAVITSYQWSQTAGTAVVLNNLNTNAASFTAPAVANDTLLSFQVVVTDNQGATASSIVNITVNASIRTLLANAGNSQTVYQEAGVTLTGSAKDATAGETITYQWKQLSGPPVLLNNANAAVAGFASPVVAHPIQFLNEQNLELIFGLVDSTRDPFSQGPTVGDTQRVVQRWSLEGVQWNHFSDPEGILYLDVENVAGQPSQLSLYREKGRVTLLASGRGNTPGEVVLSPQNNSGVSGRVLIGAISGSVLIGLSVFPRMLSWQRQHLRSVWQQQDFQFTIGSAVGDLKSQITGCNLSGVIPGQNTDSSGIIYVSLQKVAGPNYQVSLYKDAARTSLIASGTNATTSGSVTLAAANNSGLSGSAIINYQADSSQISLPVNFTNPPIVDPDQLIPGDFKYPVATDPAYSLFTARQTTIQGWISQLKTQIGDTVSGLNGALQSVLKDPKYYPSGTQISDLLALNTESINGTDISPQLAALQLPLSAFNYLVLICPIIQSGIPLLDSEWSNIFSILTQVMKVRAYSAWRIIEGNAKITLSPDFFVYPPSQPGLPVTGIDASGLLVPYGALDTRWTIVSTPSSNASAPAYVTNNSYPIGVAWIADDASSRWISHQADESGNTSQGEQPGLYTYRTSVDLTGYDPASVSVSIRVAVDDELRAVRVNGTGIGLTASGYDGFTTLAINGPFQTGVNTLDFIVFNAGSSPNPSGLRVEFSYASPLNPVALPAWRATQEQRKLWQNAVNAKIDQDMSLATGLAAVADQTEQQTLTELRDALVAACAFEASVPTLYSTGQDRYWYVVSYNPPVILVEPVDAQWTITSTPTGGAAVAVISNPNVAWLPNDGPSVWISPSQNETATAPGDAPGNYTYHTTFDLSLFDPAAVQIQMRVAVDNTVSAVNLNGQSLGLAAAGFAAFTPLTINKGFIQGINTLDVVVNNAGTTPNPSGLRVAFTSTAPLPVTADWISQILLIDVESTSLQKVTRKDEATTMMQSLFFGLRNGEFEDLEPFSIVSSWSLIEEPGAFDQEWYWMGTYSNWQAVMRVFLYPENLLLPTTRLPGSGTNGQPMFISERTSAFDNFVSELDQGAPITPDQALKLTADYVSGLKKAPYLAAVPADLQALQYPDPGAIAVGTASWGPAASDWSTPAANPFLWEAWYFVPVQIALELQKAGQFEAALDWFRLVYRYDLPLVADRDNTRRVFTGLLNENALTQFTYVQIPTWMIDSANPHQVAPTRRCPYTRFTILSIGQCLIDFADAQFGTETEESVANARLLYLQAQNLLDQIEVALPTDPVTDANPLFEAIRKCVATRLFNVRSGRNIAGMLIPVQSGESAVSIQPSAYRYSALMQQAKQLVTLAQQVEATYLASMEKADNEAYTELKASQDLETANATVTLQQLQLQTATDGITLVNDQVAKANDAVNHYNSLINSDIVSEEQTAIDFQWAAVGLQTASAAASIASLYDPIADLFGGAGSLATGLSSLASAASTTASVLNSQASLEEKQSDWQFGLSQAQNDVAISQQQVVIATDQQATAQQQLTICQLQSDHASATVNFLANKFTNADLYRWMSGVLGGVYAYFLQQAAAMARLAEKQLAFERQRTALSVIRPSYWQPFSTVGLGPQGSQGLTGAETLLEDITTVDEYAFSTDQVKLQVTKVLSLALLDPYAFQQFTETGVLRFTTPMSLFDRDFPGQYLRMISQVRVAVVALIPPGLGICATLANSGISRVIVKNNDDSFAPVLVQRDPQLIVLSSPTNSTGMFPLTANSQSELLLPFEDLGVDTTWEFTMPKASNAFDYSTIADVQVSIDYTALDSLDYRLQVIQQLDQSVSADRAYSFKQQFPDAWYALNNATQYTTPFTVQVQSEISDFPPNLLNLSIAQLLIYLIPADGASFQLQPTLQYTPSGSSTLLGGAAGAGLDPNAPPTYVFSTRRGNASAWDPILGQNVAGNWTFALPNTAATAGIFQNEQIQDILFVITYNAKIPAWPS